MISQQLAKLQEGLIKEEREKRKGLKYTLLEYIKGNRSCTGYIVVCKTGVLTCSYGSLYTGSYLLYLSKTGIIGYKADLLLGNSILV